MSRDAIEAVIDSKEWVAALNEYVEEVTNHDLPYILNKRGRNIASKAAKFTPKATKAEIKADLSRQSNGGRNFGPWLFVLTNAKRKKKGLSSVGGKAMSGPAIEFMKGRNSSAAYIAAGWLPAIIKFGGHSKREVHSKSKINEAQNKLATAGDLVAILENTARGSGDVGFEALEKAIAIDTRDMLEHVERLQARAKKHSAK